MSEHFAKVVWAAVDHKEKPGTYSRDLEVIFSDTAKVEASAASDYLGTAEKADPEQLLVSALASCHMLYFLAICEGQGYVVSSYSDNAKGIVAKREEGGFWVSEIILNPKVEFSSEKQPDRNALERLHHRAHKGCFIANSIKTVVKVEIA
ncbi:MAG: OsmC family protein [Candidatus Pseudomonas phytovorans]|uniref:OsmC family protein n=1 Tax=Candidatus Pseudomonas phytovorans TaxID=3121377 RepID=A0AAJ5WEU9_9PSED|nr:OsmC family protein [Pseudomonas sp.]WEK29634.1 MAG: OsmC family protein [Pseudomonas sp.]